MSPNTTATRKQDCYAILKVPLNASLSQIKTQYHKLALVLHPDKIFGNQAATPKFQLLQEAYSVLSDPSQGLLYKALWERQRNEEAARLAAELKKQEADLAAKRERRKKRNKRRKESKRRQKEQKQSHQNQTGISKLERAIIDLKDAVAAYAKSADKSGMEFEKDMAEFDRRIAALEKKIKIPEWNMPENHRQKGAQRRGKAQKRDWIDQ